MLVVESNLASRALNPRLVRVRTVFFAVALIALLVVALSAGADVRRVRRDGRIRIVPGQIIVIAQPGSTLDVVKAAADAAGCDIKRNMLAKDRYLLSVRPINGVAAKEADTVQVAQALKAGGKFTWAGPDRVRPILDIPNDPRYAEQWHHQVMNMPLAWGLQKSTPNVIVADLDSGIDINHPDLKDKLMGFHNFADGSNDMTDNVPHGTHTAGIAAASTDNGIGVSGVAWGNCRLYAAKVGDEGIFDSAVEDALIYVRTTLNTPGNRVVVNMSFGGFDTSDDPDPNDPYNRALLDAAGEGIILCISAGNSFDQGNPSINPANLASLSTNIICVGACGKNKEHSFYSSSRPYTTISAPGGDDPTFSNNADQILSTLPTANGGPYGYEQGTSMAAPCCTGVVALLMSTGVSSDQIKQILVATADTGGRSVPNPDFGYGVIDANAAVALAKTAINLANPANGKFVYGQTPVQLTAGDPSKFNVGKLTIDNDPTVVGTATATNLTIQWNTQATDPITGAPLYPNGTHTVHVAVTTTTSPINFVRTVRVDNPIATLTSPAGGGYVSKTANVVGTSDGLRIPTYTLEYGLGTSPSTYVSIVANTRGKIQGGTLGTWNLSGIPDGLVTLRLRVKNQDGFEVSTTSLVTVDQTAPTIPTGLAGVSGHQTASLTWNPSTDPVPGLLVGYNVYRSTQAASGFTLLNKNGPQPNPGYQDGNLANGTTYFYKVTAVDAAGNESPQTNFIDVTPNRNGTTSGQVIALDGTYLSSATITVQQNGITVPNGVAQTDTAGQFAFAAPPGFPAGTYDLTASAPGYVPQILPNGFTVALGKDAPDQNFVLQPQPVLPADLPGGWSMFTLPYDFHGQSLASVFPGALVKYYNPATGTYLNPGDPGFALPAPGVGYWVNYSGGTAPAVVKPGTPDAPIQAVSITVHKGWNVLGNPFQDAFHWNLNNLILKRADNGLQASLNVAVTKGWSLDYAWGGPAGKTLIYDRNIIPGIADTIPGYGAFWFFSGVEGTLSIAPPPVTSRSVSGSRAASGNSSISSYQTMKNAWTTEISARSGSQSTTVYVGVIGTGVSRKVMPAAPVFDAASQSLSLSLTGDGTGLVAPDANTQGFAVDLRTTMAGTQTWDVTLGNSGTSSGDQPVVLTWPGASRVPRGWTLSLIDKANGQRYNLRNTSSVTLSPLGSTNGSTRAVHNLQLELSRDSGQRMLITDLAVNVGNGRAGSASAMPNIMFNMSKEGQVSLSIIRANGDTVRTLSNGRSSKVGQNSLVWDTKDSQGRSVSPGVYLVQVRANGDKGDSARAVVSFVITR